MCSAMPVSEGRTLVRISGSWTMGNMSYRALLEGSLVSRKVRTGGSVIYKNFSLFECLLGMLSVNFLSLLYLSCLSVSDMIKRRNLRTRNIKVLVLDEADEMLNKGEYQ